jgi:arylsulfatase A-like enzyme
MSGVLMFYFKRDDIDFYKIDSNSGNNQNGLIYIDNNVVGYFSSNLLVSNNFDNTFLISGLMTVSFNNDNNSFISWNINYNTLTQNFPLNEKYIINTSICGGKYSNKNGNVVIDITPDYFTFYIKFDNYNEYKNKLNSNRKNAILIVLDQMRSYQLVPKELLDILPGYQAFKKIGIEFDSAICNRSACSPARAVIQTGILDTGVQDSINAVYQQPVVPRIDPSLNTGGHLFKNNGYKTAYVGKNHLYNLFDTSQYIHPNWCTNMKGALKIYGYDTFNEIGDGTDVRKGMFIDAYYLELNMPPNSVDFDYYNEETDTKQSGILPYLRARNKDNDPFYLEFHITNPHDIHECKMNLSQDSTGDSTQFYFPFMDEQLKDENISISPYYFNEEFKDAYIKNVNLTTNYFEKEYDNYKNNLSSMPSLESFVYDFCLNPITNKINPYYIGFYYFFSQWTTCAEQSDIKTWKNLINTYYGLVVEADSYIYKIYKELDKLNMLDNTCVIITSDHGENISAHGMRSKGVPFKEAISIPIILYDKNIELKNSISNYLCSLLDIIPTFKLLCNLDDNIDTQFLGNSLVVKYNDKYYSKENNETNSNLHLFNCNDGLMMYFMYANWLSTTSISSKLNIYKAPDNWFNWQYSFVLINKYYNNKLYKYGRFFSLTDLLYTNSTIETKITLAYLDSVLDTYIIDGYNVFIKIKRLFNVIFPKNVPFSVTNGLSLLYSYIGNGDNIYLFAYLGIVFKQLSTDLNNIYYIPGYNKNYYVIKSENQLRQFCYNLSDDPSEVYNMLDPSNYNEENDLLFYNLNNSLNESLVEKSIDNLLFIVPYDTILGMIVTLFEQISYEYTTNNKISFTISYTVPFLININNIVKNNMAIQG